MATFTAGLNHNPITSPAAMPKDAVSSTGNLGIYTIDTLQRHLFGTRYITWDGRVYKYAKAGATQIPNVGSESYVAQALAYATVASSTAIGAKKLIVDVAASDGPAADGLVLKDHFQGGYMIIFPGSNNCMNRLIEGNTAVASGGGECTFELDAPLNIATVVDVTAAEAMASPYADVRTGASDFRAIVGIPVAPATVSTYCWLQTWGPIWVSPQAEVGAGGSDLQAVFRHDGSLDEHDYSDSYTAKQQHAGFILSHATAETQGAPFLMLQISI